MKNSSSRNSPNKPCDLELDYLLHPAGAFSHPRDVISDPDLTLNEKQAILASWASDACAMEAAPALRTPRTAPGQYRSMTSSKPCARWTGQPSNRGSSHPGRDAK